MRVIPAAVLLCALCSAAVASAEVSGGLAVMPLDTAHSKLTEADRIGIEETLRTTAGDQLRDAGIVVMTGENQLQILKDNNVDPNKACEASCALQAAKELNVTYYLSGAATTGSDGVHQVFLRLSSVKDGRQLSSLEIDGSSPAELRKELRQGVSKLFDPLRARPAPVAVVAPRAAPTERPVATRPPAPAWVAPAPEADSGAMPRIVGGSLLLAAGVGLTVAAQVAIGADYQSYVGGCGAVIAGVGGYLVWNGITRLRQPAGLAAFPAPTAGGHGVALALAGAF